MNVRSIQPRGSGIRRQCHGAVHRLVLPAVMAVAMALVSSGCLIVPHKEATIAGVRVPEEATRPFVVGQTTRVEVLHLLGMPDRVDHEARVFAYHWKRSSAFWMVILPGMYTVGAVGGEITTAQDFVLLEFDETGRLERFDRVRDKGLPRSPEAVIQPWIDASEARGGGPAE